MEARKLVDPMNLSYLISCHCTLPELCYEEQAYTWLSVSVKLRMVLAKGIRSSDLHNVVVVMGSLLGMNPHIGERVNSAVGTGIFNCEWMLLLMFFFTT